MAADGGRPAGQRGRCGGRAVPRMMPPLRCPGTPPRPRIAAALRSGGSPRRTTRSRSAPRPSARTPRGWAAPSWSTPCPRPVWRRAACLRWEGGVRGTSPQPPHRPSVPRRSWGCRFMRRASSAVHAVAQGTTPTRGAEGKDTPEGAAASDEAGHSHSPGRTARTVGRGGAETMRTEGDGVVRRGGARARPGGIIRSRANWAGQWAPACMAEGAGGPASPRSTVYHCVREDGLPPATARKVPARARPPIPRVCLSKACPSPARTHGTPSTLWIASLLLPFGTHALSDRATEQRGSRGSGARSPSAARFGGASHQQQHHLFSLWCGGARCAAAAKWPVFPNLCTACATILSQRDGAGHPHLPFLPHIAVVERGCTPHIVIPASQAPEVCIHLRIPVLLIRAQCPRPALPRKCDPPPVLLQRSTSKSHIGELAPMALCDIHVAGCGEHLPAWGPRDDRIRGTDQAVRGGRHGQKLHSGFPPRKVDARSSADARLS